jgi:hypothetical protein
MLVLMRRSTLSAGSPLVLFVLGVAGAVALSWACSTNDATPAPPAPPPAPTPTTTGDPTPVDDAGAQPEASVTLPSSTDGLRNGTETDIDCGGEAAPACRDGKRCLMASDCLSLSCVGKICAVATANDGIKNAGETDIDCGGMSAPKCGDAKACVAGTDCASQVCTEKKCIALSASDGVKNGTETDIDCGGPAAPKCGTAKACAMASDCASGVCTGSVCQAPTATDGLKNGDESDVDCGGTITGAPACGAGKGCARDADCTTSVCSQSNHCAEAPSCRILRGGETCGPGETGNPNARHESCCKSLPVAGLTVMQGGVPKQVYLDKYEITAGRVRTWIEAIKAQYGGVPNIRAWISARVAADPLLAAMYPTAPAPFAAENMTAFLPSRNFGETKRFTVSTNPDLRPNYGGQNEVDVDIGLYSQIGPTTYFRGLTQGGTSGCAMYAGGYGHRSVWNDETMRAHFGELSRGDNAARDVLDEKSANCMTPLMFAAFCAWDGGYMMTRDALLRAYGPDTLPWGQPAAGLTANQDANMRANYNINGLGNLAANPPRYNYPFNNNYPNGLTQLIAPPGRFTQDFAQARPEADTWMDLGGNHLEWYHNGAGQFHGWAGSSFEGHAPSSYGTRLYNVWFLDKYGKGTSRCMRLK